MTASAADDPAEGVGGLVSAIEALGRFAGQRSWSGLEIGRIEQAMAQAMRLAAMPPERDRPVSDDDLTLAVYEPDLGITSIIIRDPPPNTGGGQKTCRTCGRKL